MPEDLCLGLLKNTSTSPALNLRASSLQEVQNRIYIMYVTPTSIRLKQIALHESNTHEYLYMNLGHTKIIG